MSTPTVSVSNEINARSALAEVESVVQRMRHDTTKYGEWQCDYNEWLRQANEQLDAAMKLLAAEPLPPVADLAGEVADLKRQLADATAAKEKAERDANHQCRQRAATITAVIGVADEMRRCGGPQCVTSNQYDAWASRLTAAPASEQPASDQNTTENIPTQVPVESTTVPKEASKQAVKSANIQPAPAKPDALPDDARRVVEAATAWVADWRSRRDEPRSHATVELFAAVDAYRAGVAGTPGRGE